MRRRRALVAVAAAATVAAVAGGLAVRSAADGGADRPADAASTTTAEVRRTTLVEEDELDGELGYRSSTAVSVGREGTVTRLPAVGSTVDRGGMLLELDGRPVPLLLGERPLWRALHQGVDDGPDVKQLEENLVAFGHATTRTLDVDDRFGADTATAVKRWEKALGLDRDGRVDVGDAVFLPTTVRVAAHERPVGAVVQPGTELVSVSAAQKVVTVDLDAARGNTVKAGDPVQVELPDGTRTPGRIAEVGAVVEGGSDDGNPGEGDEEPTVEVTVTFDDPKAVAALEAAPVTVWVVRNRVEGVLAVPVHALLARAEGGYAVEKKANGRTDVVPVEAGVFADGLVEVRGSGLAEGDRVMVPA